MGRGETQRWSEDRALELDDVPGRDSVALSQKRQKKCSREESNLHGFPHTVLSRTRLPFRHVSARLLSCAREVAAQEQSTITLAVVCARVLPGDLPGAPCLANAKDRRNSTQQFRSRPAVC